MNRPVLVFLIVVVTTFFTRETPAADNSFQLNTTAVGNQAYPSIATDGANNFVVAWEDRSAGFINTRILVQRFDATGAKIGEEFTIGAVGDTTPSVAMAGNGGFVVVWTGQDDSYTGIYAQCFDVSGAGVTGVMQVNVTTLGPQRSPQVARNSDGAFTVVWEDFRDPDYPELFDYLEGNDGSGSGIFAQRYDSNCAAVGGEFQVNTTFLEGQNVPSVAISSMGDFVVVWSGDDSSDLGVFGQRFDNLGNRSGREFRVNSLISDRQDEPSVGMDESGNFVVAWTGVSPSFPDINEESTESDIYAQRFDSGGGRVGAEFVVNSDMVSYQHRAAVAMDRAGDFAVAWYNRFFGLSAQLYKTAAIRIGGEQQVTETGHGSGRPAVAMMDNGDSVVVWSSCKGWTEYYDCTRSDIHAKRIYATTGDLKLAASVPPEFVTGSSVDSIFTVTNNGSRASRDVVLNVSVPSDIDVVVTAGSRWVCSRDASTLSCLLPELPASSSSNVVLTISTAVTATESMEFDAMVHAAETDINPADNEIHIVTNKLIPSDGTKSANEGGGVFDELLLLLLLLLTAVRARLLVFRK